MILGLNAYVSDISKPDERTMRLAFIELMFIAGLAIAGKVAKHVQSYFFQLNQKPSKQSL